MLCFWLFVIYHTLAGLVYTVSVMKNRPESAEHLTQGLSTTKTLDFILCALLVLKCNPLFVYKYMMS